MPKALCPLERKAERRLVTTALPSPRGARASELEAQGTQRRCLDSPRQGAGPGEKSSGVAQGTSLSQNRPLLAPVLPHLSQGGKWEGGALRPHDFSLWRGAVGWGAGDKPTGERRLFPREGTRRGFLGGAPALSLAPPWGAPLACPGPNLHKRRSGAAAASLGPLGS